MVGKKTGDMSNGTTKYRDQQSSMSYQKKDTAAGGSTKNDARSQNGKPRQQSLYLKSLTFAGNAFRTDGAISGGRNQLEGRTLQRWQPDGPADTDGSLESGSMNSSGKPWDQFEENKRRFGITTDYDENIYTTTIDKSHPNHKQRMAEADKKAREIMNNTAFNSHVAEERIKDHAGGEDGVDEEAK
jgi:PAB1-binding protein PBP1